MTKKKNKKKNLTEGEGGTLETRVLFIQSGKLRKSTTDLLFFKLRELILEKKKTARSKFWQVSSILSAGKIHTQQGGVSSDSWGEPHWPTVTNLTAPRRN